MQISAVGSSYGYGSPMEGVQNLSRLKSLSQDSLSSLDTDGNGSISESEFEQAFSGTTPTGTTSAPDAAATDQADSLFKKIDSNGDGQISSSEWNSFEQKLQGHGHHHHHQAESSDSADSSSDSTQSLQNLVAQLYKAADTDGNGQLSQSELTSFLTGSSTLV